MKKSLLSLAAAVALVLTGCSSDSSPEIVDEPAGQNETSQPQPSEETQSVDTAETEPSDDAADDSSEESEDQAGDDLTAPFDATLRWADGSTLSISQPVVFEVSNPYTAEDISNTPVRMTVSFHNGSDEPLDAGMFTASATSGSQVAESIFASEDGIETPFVSILPGRDIQFDIAFDVADPSDITVEFDRFDFVHDAAFFGGEALPAGSQPSGNDDQTESSESEETEYGTSDIALPFGSTYEWEDGSTVSISTPTAFEISNPYTAEDYSNTPLRMTVTFHNASNEPVDTVMFMAAATSGGKAASIYSSSDGLDGVYVSILPGKDLSFDIAFDAADPDHITVQFDRGDFTSEPAYFETK